MTTTATPKTQTSNWQDVAKRVRARIEDVIRVSYRMDPGLIPTDLNKSVVNIAANSGVLSARELEITESKAYELLPKLAEKMYTAVEVTEAFCKRATIAHQAVSARILFHLLRLQIKLTTHLGFGVVDELYCTCDV